jgi:hypothetical protein
MHHTRFLNSKLIRTAAALAAVAALLALTPASTSQAADRVEVRGAYGYDGDAYPNNSFDDVVAAGVFNTVNGSHYPNELDVVYNNGLQAVVWLGPYNNSTCSFAKSDDWVRQNVPNVAGHPAVIAYQLADEINYPRVEGCPNIADQVRARSDLVKSLDPAAETYVTVAAWDGFEEYPFQYFTDVADIIGLVIYPCSHSKGCDFDEVYEAIAEADADGIGRYWAVIQAFEDGWYKQPTYEQLKRQLEIWTESSRMEGYFIYEWGGIEQFTNEQLAALDSRFVDVPRSAPFYDEITWLASEGITAGCNPPLNDRFCPGDHVSRGEMAAFLARALGYSAVSGADTFVDDDNSVFEGDIEKLKAAGVTSGCNPPVNNRYCPGSNVTRGQMAAFLARALDYTAAGSVDSFVDDNDSPFEADIEKLRAAGVTLGCNPPVNDRYCPDSWVTRGQMAAFLARALG